MYASRSRPTIRALSSTSFSSSSGSGISIVRITGAFDDSEQHFPTNERTSERLEVRRELLAVLYDRVLDQFGDVRASDVEGSGPPLVLPAIGPTASARRIYDHV